MFKFIIPLFFIGVSPVFAAQTPEPADPPAQEGKPNILEKTGEAIEDTGEQVSKTLEETRLRRENSRHLVLGNYSPLDLLIPSKYGLTLGWIQNASRTWELEYLKGSVSVPFIVEDLGEMTDTRITLLGRSYAARNSFNFSYGLSYLDFSLHLGDKILNRVSGGGYPSLDLVKLEALGFNIGLGNRWTFKHNITFGVDWVSWTQPLVVLSKKSIFLDYASNQQDKDDVDDALNLVSYFPRFVLLKLQIGMSF